VIFDRAGFARAFDVSRETMARLDALVATIERWQRAINLISRRTLPEVWHRHVADSAQLLALAPATAQSWADFGAGAGFPGLVVAALACEARPDLAVTLVESDQRKMAFLAEAARAMDVAVTLFADRVSELPPASRFDVISARALAPLPALLAMARPHLVPGGTLLFPKGAEAETELALLSPIDRATATRIASLTQPSSTILKWA
jgi:16S rRNA (guanine527-N7)-methyltransferase